MSLSLKKYEINFILTMFFVTAEQMVCRYIYDYNTEKNLEVDAWVQPYDLPLRKPCSYPVNYHRLKWISI